MMDVNVGSFEENHGRIQAIACKYAKESEFHTNGKGE
jgi:hypothetical protein